MIKSNLLAMLALGAGISLAACTQVEEKQVELSTQQPTEQDSEEAKSQIREMLQAQSDCWSQGNLDCFMRDYWKSDSLLFVGKSGLTYGWQKTLDNYRKSYPDASAMGKLEFTLKEMRPLSQGHMLVVGQWHLQREEALGDLKGHFSIILKHFPDGWKIIADHSS
jgi:ketosteroid isomerase-like protein